jgi:hypothetical protein
MIELYVGLAVETKVHLDNGADSRANSRSEYRLPGETLVSADSVITKSDNISYSEK